MLTAISADHRRYVAWVRAVNHQIVCGLHNLSENRIVVAIEGNSLACNVKDWNFHTFPLGFIYITTYPPILPNQSANHEIV